MNVAILMDFENVYYGLINQYNFKPRVGHLVSLYSRRSWKKGHVLIRKAYAD